MSIFSLIHLANPGEFSHFGDWLPIGTLLDNLGSPHRSKNINIVDASILPTIPLGLTIFIFRANSRRIVKESFR
jgi:hypothetical protein